MFRKGKEKPDTVEKVEKGSVLVHFTDFIVYLYVDVEGSLNFYNYDAGLFSFSVRKTNQQMSVCGSTVLLKFDTSNKEKMVADVVDLLSLDLLKGKKEILVIEVVGE